MGEPKRDRWGRYLLPDPKTGEERAYTRATTISGLLSDRYNLEKWSQRMVIAGLAKRTDLLMLAKGVKDPRSPGGKKTLNRIAKDAQEAAAAGARANIGTAIHAATEALDRGEDPDIPPPYDRDVEVYGATMDKLGIEPVPGWIERIVVAPQLGDGVAGTLDRLMLCKDWPEPRIADIKTGSTVHFSELDHAIQQSIYANATHYWDEEREELVPMPRIDKKHALIVHLPAGEARCEVHVLDIVQGWEAAQIAAAVHRLRKAKDLSAEYVPGLYGKR
jgi:hypothetical protein